MIDTMGMTLPARHARRSAWRTLSKSFNVRRCALTGSIRGSASVVTIVLALAVANLGLGFALAVALDRLPVWSTWPIERRAKPGSPARLDVTGRGVEGPMLP